jgi:hypothetical protein
MLPLILPVLRFKSHPGQSNRLMRSTIHFSGALMAEKNGFTRWKRSRRMAIAHRVGARS